MMVYEDLLVDVQPEILLSLSAFSFSIKYRMTLHEQILPTTKENNWS
jgi:hypothetical protein